MKIFLASTFTNTSITLTQFCIFGLLAESKVIYSWKKIIYQPVAIFQDFDITIIMLKIVWVDFVADVRK